MEIAFRNAEMLDQEKDGMVTVIIIGLVYLQIFT